MILALALAVSSATLSRTPATSWSAASRTGAGEDAALDVVFDLVDVNHDNRISRDEMHRARRRFAQMSETERRSLIGRIFSSRR